MPKGQTSKKLGQSYMCLSMLVKRVPNYHEEEIILLKLKKKLYFKGHVYFERVMPQKIRAALKYLLGVNPLYHNVLIKDCSVNEDLLSSGSNLPKSNIDFDLESEDELESAYNLFSTYRHAANKSLAIYNENVLGLGLGQDKEIKHILFDEKCKEVAFPKIFLHLPPELLTNIFFKY